MSDSITWRQFCRIGLDQPVPHPTTLMKLTTRCGSTAVEGLNEALLAKAAEAKLLRCTRIRVDTTVVPSNVAYPTDSGLLAKAVRRIAATGRRIQAAGGAVRTRLRDRSRAAGRRAHDLNAKLRTRSATAKQEAMDVVRRKNAELADLAETAAAEAERLLGNAKRALRTARKKAADLAAAGGKDAAAGRRRGRLARAVNDLTELLEATRRIAAQTRQRITGVTPDGATRRVSLHDPDARPIAKGRLGKPVEFGHKAQICDNDDGIVLDHDVQPGNPTDAPRLRPAVERVKKRTGQDTANGGRRPRLRRTSRRRRPTRPRHQRGRDSPQGPTRQSPTSPRTTTNVPTTPEMAYRLRRTDQQPQTQLRVGSNHDRHHRRCPDLDRTRNPRPQPSQDQRPGRLTPPGPPAHQPRGGAADHPNPTNPAPATISGRSS